MQHARPGAEVFGESIEHRRLTIQNGHVGLKPYGHLRRLETDHTATQNQHPAGRDSRDSAKQHTAGMF